MTREPGELWPLLATRIHADRGWRLRPLARLGRPQGDRCTWLAEGEPGAVIVKVSANPFAAERAAWKAEALALLRARGLPVPVPLWQSSLDGRWWVVVEPRLPGKPRRRAR
jgi:Ser/Thr protein kinase RdoA (MazF antagonist)